MIRYFVFEVEGRPRGMNVWGVKGCLSIIRTSKTFPCDDERNFRGEQTNMFITGFASFLEGDWG